MDGDKDADLVIGRQDGRTPFSENIDDDIVAEQMATVSPISRLQINGCVVSGSHSFQLDSGNANAAVASLFFC